MMAQVTRDFPRQFAYVPVVENAARLPRATKFLVCGMGGSAHPTALIKIRRPELDVVIHRSYGLPRLAPADLASRFVLAVSYSGNTEEPIDAYDTARAQGLPVAVVATGGVLLERARRDGVPYVALPDATIEPRSGMGYTVRAELALMGDEEGLRETSALASVLDVAAAEAAGRALAEKLRGAVPVVYASHDNAYLAYVWKIKLNETAKVPAFCHEFPELNHNELNGYDFAPANRALSERFHFVFLEDQADHPRILKRMTVTEQLCRARGFGVEVLMLAGETVWERVFSSLLVADWTCITLAQGYGVAPDGQPMVEEFKRLIAP
jgi:glucose/mannose-6-phosphate isomerase